MYPWESPQLFVWMGIDTPEVREIALREHGLPLNGGDPVRLRIYFRACPVCGRMAWTSSADPWHPADDAEAVDASRDAGELVARYRDRVRVEIVPPNSWEVDRDICEPCTDAWQRAPEVMAVVRNMIGMAVHEHDRVARAKQAQEDA